MTGDVENTIANIVRPGRDDMRETIRINHIFYLRTFP